MKSEARPYRMSARADAAAGTAERILDAAVELFWEAPTEQLVLADVAERAGVTVQTVIRRFGSRAALLAAAARREQGRVADERRVGRPGAVDEAVDTLLAHYEKDGARALRLEQETSRVPGLAHVLAEARQVHVRWCAESFAPQLARRAPDAAERLLAQLVAVCDVHVWETLGRVGLGPAQRRTALLEILHGLVEES
jgi:AcrR family transcriptional regulator